MSTDPDFALKLEKAIVDKYGSEAVVHPKKEWNTEKEKKYLSEIKKFYFKNSKTFDRVQHKGFLISKKLFNIESKKYCNYCETYKPHLMNRVYFIKHDCCFACYIKNIEGRK